MIKKIGLISVCLLQFSVVSANDSSATLGAGGLQLTKSANISMENEELYISRSKIRVEYIFKNNSTQDIDTLVAFPLPRVMSDLALSEVNVNIPNTESENFVNFTVKVNGQETPFHIKHKAFLVDDNGKKTQEITKSLQKYALPISPFAPNYRATLNDLSDTVKEELLEKQWLAKNEYDAGQGLVIDYMATWETETLLYWQQVFPAQQTIKISHEYTPIVGSWFINYDNGQVTYYNDEKQRFCIDKPTQKGIDKKNKAISNQASSDQVNLLFARHIQYILTTGANWQGAIKHFKLTLDKEDPKSILSVCLPKIKKINATQFSLEYENFLPKKDLEILIVE